MIKPNPIENVVSLNWFQKKEHHSFPAILTLEFLATNARIRNTRMHEFLFNFDEYTNDFESYISTCVIIKKEIRAFVYSCIPNSCIRG